MTGRATGVVVAVDAPVGTAIVDELVRAGADPVTRIPAAAMARAAEDPLRTETPKGLPPSLPAGGTLVLQLRRDTINPALATLCDRAGVRIVALCGGADDTHLAALYGLRAALDLDLTPAGIAAAVLDPASVEPAPAAEPGGRVIAVWGPAGAPGRTTLAIEIAVELARVGRRVALVDADTHAPSVALALGLADEGPGFAAVCRLSEREQVSAAELARIALPLGGGVDVLAGINRPARWPELSRSRVLAALEACRGWVDDIVVDVASSLERDEEIVSDLGGPRRNAAALAALEAADLVVAVAAADPVGIARFVRGWGELRAAIGATPVVPVVNRLRAGPVGVDARGQVRAALERFCGIRRLWFLPQDPRAAEAAVLASRPLGAVAGRSALSAGIRRLVAEALAAAPDAAVTGERRRGRRSPRPRRAVAAPLV